MASAKHSGVACPFLEGRTIALRPLELSDVPALLPWFNRVEHRSFFGLSGPVNASELEDIVGKSSAHEAKVAIVVKETDALIGVCHLTAVSLVDGGCTLALMIGEPRAGTKGCDTDAACLMVQYAFDTLRLHRVSVLVDAEEQRQIKAYEKAGFRHEAVRRDDRFVAGRYHDTVLMGVLRSEWPQKK